MFFSSLKLKNTKFDEFSFILSFSMGFNNFFVLILNFSRSQMIWSSASASPSSSLLCTWALTTNNCFSLDVEGSLLEFVIRVVFGMSFREIVKGLMKLFQLFEILYIYSILKNDFTTFGCYFSYIWGLYKIFFLPCCYSIFFRILRLLRENRMKHGWKQLNG